MNLPLAHRLRPRTFDEIFGQENLIGPLGILRKAAASGELFSFILWGPPGSGKTTIARVVAQAMKAQFIEFSAVTSGVADVRKTIETAKKLKDFGTKTILFVDEIHHFNKTQQDAFLPHVEDGTIILIGATTENPFFEVTNPLLSRLKVLKLEPLPKPLLEKILDRGEKELHVQVDEKGKTLLLTYAAGDARRILSALEAAHLVYPNEKELSEEKIQSSLEKKIVTYDQSGDFHYDTISAFIKSIRGSSPDGALHWLARMVQAGEDPRFIARRLIILASEDIGNADPMGLVVAVAAAQGVEHVGMPEAQLILAQATTYLACAPKSNASYLALNAAMAEVESMDLPPVPLHLRNAAVPEMKEFGMGIGYKYPHDFPEHFVEQNYMPIGWEQKVYYHPTDHGEEATLKKRLQAWWEKRKHHEKK